MLTSLDGPTTEEQAQMRGNYNDDVNVARPPYHRRTGADALATRAWQLDV
jgi:hypothetical protein